MRIRRLRAGVGLLAASMLLLTACGTDRNVPEGWTMNPALQKLDVQCGTEPVIAEGSSAQKNAMDIFARAYGIKCEGQQLNYTPSGSGKGIAAFTAGQVHFAGSDAPLSREDGEVAAARERCGGNPAWHIPMVFGPLAITYNLPGIENLVLSPEVIAKIYQGKITEWNDPAIQRLNPGTELPAINIVPFYRSDESGTSANFQKYLSVATDGLWKGEGQTFIPGGGVGQGRAGTDGVTSAVEHTKGGITYATWAFPKNVGLSIAAIDSGNGPVPLTAETAARAVDNAEFKGSANDHDLRLNLKSIYGNDSPGVYPIVLATYEIVCSQGYPPKVAQGVKAALKVAANVNPDALVDAGYVPLPPKFKSEVVDAIEAIRP